MAQKKKTKAMVVSQEKLADGIYDLRLETELAQDAACGQFVGVTPRIKVRSCPDRSASVKSIRKKSASSGLSRGRQGNGRIFESEDRRQCVSAWRFGKWFPGGQGKAGHEDYIW